MCFSDKMKNVRHILSATLLVALMALGGCEGESDTDSSGVDDYFEANPYSSEAREDPGETSLQISPVLATLSIIGESVVFKGSGGKSPFTWSVSDSNNGHIEVSGWSQANYYCDKVGNNDVIVQDQNKHSAIAHITPEVDTMTVSPSSVTLIVGEAEYYASFTVSGGTPPYIWSSGNVSLGTVSYSADTSYVAAYTAVAGAYGNNVITVRDAEGRTTSATVIQKAQSEE